MKSKRNQDSHRRKRMGRGRRYQLLAIGLLLLVCGAGVASAHYIIERIYGNNQVSAEAFYFTLDMLGDTNEPEELAKEIHLYGGGEKKVSFKVQNYFDEFRVTGVDITYSVEIAVGEGQHATYSLTNDGASVDWQQDNGGATQDTGSSKTAQFQLSSGGMSGVNRAVHLYGLTVNGGYEEGTQVKVTIASNAPYEKTMTLTYVLHTYSSAVKWRMEDQAGNPYASLIIMSDIALDQGKIQVDWSAINATANVLQVDSTSSYVMGNPLGNGKAFYDAIVVQQPVKEEESIEIRFFKADASVDYSESTTEASMENGEYLIRIPN